MKPISSDVAFSPAVKQVQGERGSRAAYARMERAGGFETEVTEDLRAFLAQVNTGFLATASADGQPYVQHRGGLPGFIQALDDHTLGFVDFVGNRQYVSTGNLSENDRVCLFLIDYAHQRRVKVWGTARAVPATDAMLSRFAPTEPRARPEQVILITVSAWDVNCPKHIPQKLDASEVAQALQRLEKRIAELETENRSLKADLRLRDSKT
ncbi:pyridoxamine 5'-phosphate oxidase [Corallococcus sp. CA047B]|uniref:pyridoxamine 5'-phosphate oxidase family protein n=1 Tax=Corallococcus sp. CA047B TaxID=2316729 RepID=UPI000EA25E23|nr:pyridoxamine 5'-phosphate oxidase family protein [Corallococcus sp. CA047B]RKH18253.1 pyridoxamine 5'-phosphate oxidase [Corallococcus sp. CA047B]